MRASIAWCVIPVPVSPVVAYRSPWSERRLRSLVSPIRGFYGIRASSVGGVSWSFVRVFRRSLLPRSGLRSQWHLRGLVLDPSVSLLRSVSRSFSSLLRSVLRRVLGSVFSFDRVVASFGFWELGLQPSLSFRTVRFPLVPRFATEWCFVGFRVRHRSFRFSFPVPFLGRSVCSQNLRRRTFRRSDRGVPDRGFSFSCVSSSEARTFETQ